MSSSIHNDTPGWPLLHASSGFYRSLPGGQPELGGFGHLQEADSAAEDSSEIKLQFPH